VVQGSYMFIAPIKPQLTARDLTASELLAIQDISNNSKFTPKNMFCVERLIDSGKVYSTGSYSARFRANDSVLTLKSVKGSLLSGDV